MIARPLPRLLLCGALLAPAGLHAQGVIADKSEIAFTMKQMGANFHGRFRKWQADVVFLPKALAASKADIDIDLGSIDLASADSDAAAGDPLWFDTAKYPTAHFASTSIRDLGGNRYEVVGRLTLKGITHDCVVPLTVKQDASGNRVAEGTFALKRLDYRIGEGEWSDTATVANDIVVRVRMVLPPEA